MYRYIFLSSHSAHLGMTPTQTVNALYPYREHPFKFTIYIYVYTSASSLICLIPPQKKMGPNQKWSPRWFKHPPSWRSLNHFKGSLNQMPGLWFSIDSPRFPRTGPMTHDPCFHQSSLGRFEKLMKHGTLSTELFLRNVTKSNPALHFHSQRIHVWYILTYIWLIFLW